MKYFPVQAFTALFLTLPCLISQLSAEPCVSLSAIDFYELAERSVNSFQEVERQLNKLRIQEDKVEQARAPFDPVIKYETGSYIESYYTGAKNDLQISRQNRLFGSKIATGIRDGSGTFPLYEDELETANSGEFYFGFSLPLLRNQAIDVYRFKEDRAKIEQAIKEVELVAKKNSVRKSLFQLLNSLAVTDQNIEALVELLDTIKKQRDITAERIERGILPKNDLLEIERILIKNESSLEQEKNVLNKTLQTLNVLFLQSSTETKLQGCNIPSVAIVHPLMPTNREEMFHQALTSRPDVLALSQQRLIAERALLLAENQALPELDFNVEYEEGLGGGHPSDTESSVKGMLRFSYPIFNRAPTSEIHIRGKLLNNLDLSKRLLRNELESKLFALLQDLETIGTQIALANRELSLAERLLRADFDSYEAGNLDLFQVSQRQTFVIDLRIKRNSLYEKYLDTLIDIVLFVNEPERLKKVYEKLFR